MPVKSGVVNFKAWCFLALNELDKERPKLIVMILHGIWLNRNAKLHAAIFKPPAVHQMALNLLAEFRKDTLELETIGKSSKKMNVYATLRLPGVVCLREVICDHEGKFSAAMGRNVLLEASPPLGEAMTIKLGLELTKSLGRERIAVESDYRQNIDALTKAASDLSLQGAVLQDCNS
ncbi:hypothetical protein Droror1_Dr00015330 [Drosera rotundifolia]